MPRVVSVLAPLLLPALAGCAPTTPTGLQAGYLLVTRYDRHTQDRAVVRLHQEDACQALGVASDRKYAAEGGPAFRDLFALTRSYVRTPALDVLKLVDAAIFNLAIGNADAHGKNFSFLLDARGPRLAPLYDLLSTIA